MYSLRSCFSMVLHLNFNERCFQQWFIRKVSETQNQICSTTQQMTTTSFSWTNFESVSKRHEYLYTGFMSTTSRSTSIQSSIHHLQWIWRVTTHPHRLWSNASTFPSLTLPTSPNLPAYHEHRASLHFTSTMPEALQTIRIRKDNINSLPSEYERIAHSSYPTQSTPSTPSKAASPTRPLFASTTHYPFTPLSRRQWESHLLLFVPTRYEKSLHTSAINLCIHDALFSTLPAAASSCSSQHQTRLHASAPILCICLHCSPYSQQRDKEKYVSHALNLLR